MSTLSSHVLDQVRGKPADGLAITLERASANDTWHLVGRGTTDADGRVRDFGAGALTPGDYRLRFAVGVYFTARGQSAFYREVPVHFVVDGNGGHYHVPLLLSPFGYATYRGS